MSPEQIEPLKASPATPEAAPEQKQQPKETEEQKERRRRQEDPNWYREQK